MTIVSRFRVPFHGHAQMYLDLRRFAGKQPVFTVLIGENGTRKSFLLRAMIDAALQSRSSKSQSQDVEFSRAPAQVIGVSAIAGDRFPASPTIGDLWQMGRYREGYTYIGPRTARNLISRKHNSRQLVLALLEHPERLEKLKGLARALREELVIPPCCAAGLNVMESMTGAANETLEEFVLRQQQRSRKSSTPGLLEGIGDIPKASAILKSYLGNGVGSPVRLGRSVKESQIQLHFNWAEGIFDGSSIPAEALITGIKTGYLRMTSLEFVDLEDDALSSGQWSLFCGTCLLGLLATDNTLVLIDEPECSLHPQWQRMYLELTRKALAGLNNCHVVVATHSSLVLSSLPGERSEVIALTRSDNQIFARHVPVPTGWDASDVIEEVFGVQAARGPEITEAFQRVLSLVAGGREKRAQLKAEVGTLEPLVEHLPPEDPLRVTFAALKGAAKGR